jgi:hypothetical protein
MPGSIIVAAVLDISLTAVYASAVYTAMAFAINVVASSIISKALAPDMPSTGNGANNNNNPNPGSRATLSPAGSNKLPVVYGSAWLGGSVTDLSITSDNQKLYYVISLCEVTGNQSSGTPDAITFGDVYFGGKKCVFNANGYSVNSLYDPSTGQTNTSVAGNLDIYLYDNGSNNPANSTKTAIEVMQSSGLTYTWDSNKLMSDCAFAVVVLTYNQNAGITGLQETKFQVTNSRTKPGECIYDYLVSTVYGAAIPVTDINTDSLIALDAYSDENFPYTNNIGDTATIPRFRFDGTLETSNSVLSNLQLMASCSDCLLRYNEIYGTWSVVVQTPTVLPVMDLNNSNIVSGIQITPIDIASSYNVAEVKFPDGTLKDAFNTATLDLAQLDPELLYPNEPVNKQTISLPLVNSDIRAQYLATRFLKAAREDLQLVFDVNFEGLQLEAGDVVTVTNSNYGWTAKQFRISKVIQKFNDAGQVLASLTLMEYNPAVYDDTDITQFQPSPNTGLGSPTFFGTLYAPSVVNLQPTITNPSFGVEVTASSSGITQYAEIWYSAYSNPSDTQRIFAATTSVNPAGNPFTPAASMGIVTLANIPAGDWYFFVRMVNALGTSPFSSASSVLYWRPTTFQFSNRYVVVAYGDDLSGTNITNDPRGKSYYGLYNSTSTSYSSNPADYTWYLASPTFGTSVYLTFSNRTGRKFSFSAGFAGYASGTAAFVPTQTTIFDPSVWSALPDGTNFIDLDARTGQLIKTGTSNVGAGQLAITNSSDGQVVASLQQFLDFGPGVTQLTGSASSVTIDIYGRVLGFTSPDGFYFTIDNFTATAGQTVFTPTARQVGYITGQDLVFKNGILLDTADYTENSTTVTLGTACVVNDKICILSFRSVSNGNFYEDLYIEVASVATTVVTYSASTLPYQMIEAGDIITFANTGSPTQYTVQSYNAATRQITMTSTVTGVTAGASIYRYRANGTTYRSYSRYTTTLTNASSYSPTTWELDSGFELLFLNGSALNEQDYDLATNTINNFPSTASGLFTVIQFAPNNTTTPAGGMTNVVINTVLGQTIYTYSYIPEAFNLFYNGSLQVQGTDYTTATGSYTLANSPTTNTAVLQQQTFSRTGAA